MLEYLPDWLRSLLIEERIKVVNGSFLEDTSLNKKDIKDFELEWQEHGKKKMDKTWSFSTKQRIEQLLVETETTLQELSTLTILDAGCGNGFLTEAIADQGARTIGVDLINNLKHITSTRKKSENLFFLHSDINDLPLRTDSFDLIISNGVLHHTPDTKKAFLHLSKHVKTGGKLYIWLYRKPFRLKNKLFLFAADSLRKVISRLPQIVQKPIIESFTKFFHILSLLRKGRNSTKDYNDLLIDMYDTFTPKYRHYHNPIEVAAWFNEASFSSPVLTHWDNSFGFGMYAIKQVQKVLPSGENYGTRSFDTNIHLS